MQAIQCFCCVKRFIAVITSIHSLLHFNNSFQCYLLQGSDLDRDDPDPDPTLEKTGQGSDRQENRIRIRNPPNKTGFGSDSPKTSKI